MLPVYRISKKHFYPRPPRGGRPQAEGAGGTRPTISIHALREEGDRDFFFFGGFLGYFYPRPPRGGRRWNKCKRTRQQTISIHALREEGDLTTTPGHSQLLNFYPRPPRGGRHAFAAIPLHMVKFLSTPSARRATLCSSPKHGPDRISIHALREEGDLWNPGQ